MLSKWRHWHANRCGRPLSPNKCLQVRKLHIDATIGNAAVRFAGTQMPLAAAGQVVASGPIAMARQVMKLSQT